MRAKYPKTDSPVAEEGGAMPGEEGETTPELIMPSIEGNEFGQGATEPSTDTQRPTKNVSQSDISHVTEIPTNTNNIYINQVRQLSSSPGLVGRETKQARQRESKRRCRVSSSLHSH